MSKANILIWDTETSPHLSYTWDVWKERIAPIQLKEPSRMLCWGAKWVSGGDSKAAFGRAEWQYRGNDAHERMIKDLHALLSRADILVAHNGDKFDLRVANREFLKYGFDPLVVRTVDTLKVSRRQFRHTWHRLDQLAQFLGVGQKMGTGGFQLWRDVLDGDKAAQDKMLRYCLRDVNILARVYDKLLPWIHNHPNVALFYDDERPRCTNCGSLKVYKHDKRVVAQTQWYQRYYCHDCGKTMRGKDTQVQPTKRSGVLATAG